MRKTWFVVFTAVSLSAFGRAALSRYWTVHIDKPRPDARVAFEQTGRDDTAVRREIFAAAGVPLPRTVQFRAADGVYYSLRPKDSLEDLGKPQPLAPDLQKQLRERTAPISERAHATLQSHHNEIWQTDNDFTQNVSTSLPRHVQMRVDEVLPPRTAAYNDVVKRVNAILQAANIGTVAFFSAYGDGSEIYLFTSDRPFRLKEVVPAALLREWRSCVSGTREVEVAPAGADWVR